MGKVSTCTVAVKGQEDDGHITINESDFDASIHKKVMVKKVVEEESESSGEEGEEQAAAPKSRKSKGGK